MWVLGPWGARTHESDEHQMRIRIQPLTAICALALACLLASCCCPCDRSNQGWPNGSAKTPVSNTIADADRPVHRHRHGGRRGQQAVEESGGAGSQVIVRLFNNPLPVVPRDQEGFYSCWAASAEMIMEFIGGVRVRQCVQADRPFYGSRCCDGYGDLVRDPDCDSPNLPEFGRWGYIYKYQFQTPLNWIQLTNEINGGRPFAFSWTRTDPQTGLSLGISHMMVVIGYSDNGLGQQAVVCLNPRPFAHTDQLLVPMAEYQGIPTPPSNIHQYDYFGIEPAL